MTLWGYPCFTGVMAAETTPLTTLKEAAMTITPAIRFHAFEVEQALPLGDLERVAIEAARHWEGFPGSYSVAQVRAAIDLLRALAEGRDPETYSRAVVRVLDLNR